MAGEYPKGGDIPRVFAPGGDIPKNITPLLRGGRKSCDTGIQI